MAFEKKYHPLEIEQRLRNWWANAGVYDFDENGTAPVRSIDTPPATVSGALHLGHIYSYSHADFLARYWRMNGYRVFYPMGYDDNGLPTERLVEKELGIDLRKVSRDNAAATCLKVVEKYEAEYEELWRRLGLSIDWNKTYRTISEEVATLSQWSFADLYERDLLYRTRSPTIWCPGCQTAVAQAELEEQERESEYVYLRFEVDGEPRSRPIFS